ncbi:MAG TPA: hypothetical protein VFK21_08185 [Gammaproteobacteria bacterium]|nr:hypothetical protein [Gammaproteobacteria bacterium]
MPKNRISIPEDIAAGILVASDSTCCKCEERGAPIQIHHIDENPSNNDPSNLAVLCISCHHETQISGGFGRHLSPSVVRKYRDQWIGRVIKRRADADAILLKKASGGEQPIPQEEYKPLERADALAYIETLPDILAIAYKEARPGFSVGSTLEVIRATYGISEVVKGMWLRLANAFPRNHFLGIPATRYLDMYLRQRYQWRRALAEPYGPGKGGTIVGVLTASGVLNDLELTVVDTVSSIRGLSDYHDKWQAWLSRWNEAKAK